MSEEKQAIGIFGRLIEAERLYREGPTLKNVSDNMQAIVVLVAIFVAVGVLYRNPALPVRVLAVLWGAWTLAYSILAAYQAGILFLGALIEIPSFRKLAVGSALAKDTIVTVAAGFAVLFMFTTIAIFGASVELVTKH